MWNVLCIGTCSNPNKNSFTGQSIMFDGIIKSLKNNGNTITVIDILPRFKSSKFFYRCLDYAIILFILLYRLITEKYDVAYIITSQSKKGFLRDFMMVGLLSLFSVKVVTHQFGANYRQLTDVISKASLDRLIWMLNYIKAIIVEGDYMKEQFSFLPNYSQKVHVVPNGLPVEGRHAQIAKTYDGKQPFIMFYLSNLIWSKGYFDVLQAVDILVNEEGLDVKCVFAGQFWNSADDERPGISNWEDFDQFVKEHSLTDKVEYHKGLYGEKKDSYFYKANVFLLPTYYLNEGQPVSIIEAMAYGCVPLVTEYRHIPMMVNEANGCFVAPKDPKDIASKIKYLMTHPAIYEEKSRKSIEDYKRKFKFDIYAGKVTECMNAVIS